MALRRGMLSLVLALLLAALPGPAAAERRVALVIGNGAYRDAPLRNPPNDARAMARTLRGLGFEVLEHVDLDNRTMNRAIAAFGERLKGGAVGLFFYAGHGMQVKGRNFLIPVDAQINGEASVRTEAVDVDAVLDQLPADDRALNIVILDACRNNPFERRFRSTGGGLAQIDASAGTLIAYATAPGKVASDGDGEHGLYTSELLKALEEPGLKVEEVFKRVRSRVSARSGNSQLPWESSSLTGDFVFRPAAGRPASASPAAVPSAAAPPSAAPAIDREALFWQSVKESPSEAGYAEYLRQYPDGAFAALARVRIKELREQDSRASRVPAPAAAASVPAAQAPAAAPWPPPYPPPPPGGRPYPPPPPGAPFPPPPPPGGRPYPPPPGMYPPP